MSDLAQLARAAGTALADADAHGAKIAAHFLRVQIHELFRELTHRRTDCRDCEHAPTEQPITRTHLHG
jgi:putative ribosome biogenesis GTPase RsgA